jgi:histone chaperone ASF1
MPGAAERRLVDPSPTLAQILTDSLLTGLQTSRTIYIDIEFKLIYVGSAESEEFDQELDSILVGPVPVGLNKFVFEVAFQTGSLVGFFFSLCLLL